MGGHHEAECCREAGPHSLRCDSSSGIHLQKLLPVSGSLVESSLSLEWRVALDLRKSKCPLNEYCLQVYYVIPEAESSCGRHLGDAEVIKAHHRHLLEMDQDPKTWGCIVLQPIVDAMQRLNAVARCICHLFCAELPAHVDATVDADVHKLSKYEGKLLMERCMKRLLMEEGSWWQTEIADMLKKGAGTALAAVKIQHLQDVLQLEAWSHTNVMSATQLLNDVKGVCRSQTLGSLLDKFVVAWPDKAMN